MPIDVKSALAEIRQSQPLAATRATIRADGAALSQLSRTSQGNLAEILPSTFQNDGKALGLPIVARQYARGRMGC
jgi:hypothetical protein